jgi:hypothetical protein
MSYRRFALGREKEQRASGTKAKVLKALREALSELGGEEYERPPNAGQVALAVLKQMPLTISRSVVVPIDCVLDPSALVQVAKDTREDQLQANQKLARYTFGLDEVFEKGQSGEELKSLLIRLIRIKVREVAKK